MDINRQTLVIITGAFILGVIFCLSLVIVAFWSYRLGRADYEHSKVEDINTASTPVAFIPTALPYPVPLYPTSGVSFTSTPLPENSPVAGTGNENSKIDPEIRKKIMDYMYSVNAILVANKNQTEPNAFAQQIMTATMNGDTTAFDNLIINYQNTKTQISALSPPPECKDYHDGCMGIMDRGIGMLEEIKGAIKSQDIDTLLAMQGKASSLEDMAREADSIAKNIYQEYNIPEPED